MSGRALLPALLAVVALCSGSARASSFRPDFRWRSLDTPHFTITWHQGEEALAAELAIVAEEVHATLSPWMRWQPWGRTQIVLVDATDDSNGYAQTVPHNAITLYAAPPRGDSALDGHQDWLWALFLHEYAHILQIDTIGGLPRALRAAFGRLIMPGAVLPSWLTEGYATFVETRTTAGGRGRSTFADALLRLSSLEGRFPAIDEADGWAARWPLGQTRYLYGARFHLWVAEQKGADRWIDFHHRHGRGIIPFILPSRAAFGETLIAMWARWRGELGRFYRDEANRIAHEGRGITAGRVLPTRPGFAFEPRYTRDGAHVIYGFSSVAERGSLRVLDLATGEDRRVHGQRGTSPRLTADGRLLWSEGAFVNDWSSFTDLYALELAADGTIPKGDRKARRVRPRRMSRGERLFDVAPHPKEAFWVAVQTVPGAHRLVRVRPRNLPPGTKLQKGEDRVDVEPVLAPGDGSTFSAPVWDPEGTRLALSVWKPGGFRDIHVLDADARLLRTLSWDRAVDADPAWTPDGRHLLWASDRDGIWNIYAYTWADGSVWRVTRVLGGVRHPEVSPDGRRLLVQSLGASGFRIEELPLDQRRWEPAPLPARALPGPDWGPSAQALHPLTPDEGVPGPASPASSGPDAAVARHRGRPDYLSRADAPPPAGEEPPGSRPYNPAPTLLLPRVLEPWGAITESGVILGLGSWGRDAVGTAAWSATLSYRTDTAFWGGSASLVISPRRPALVLNYSATSLDYGRLWLDTAPPGRPGGTIFSGVHRGQDRYVERRDRWFVGVSVPVRRHRFSLSYKVELRNPHRDLPTLAAPEYLPARGSFSGIVLGWTVSDVDRWAASISAEEGGAFSLSTDLESTALGAFRVEPDGSRSPLHRLIVTAEGRGYLPMPWRGNHVLALRAVVGVTLCTQVPQRTFRLGGSYGDSPYLSLPDRYYPLRGYPSSALRGDHLWLGSAEYRMPLLRLERGIVTLPVWFRTLSLSIFAEAGATFLDDAFSSGEDVLAMLRSTRPAVGVELVADGIVLWGSGLQGRFGYGLGFGDDAYPSGTFYAQLGASF
jgi:hypothetical protein